MESLLDLHVFFDWNRKRKRPFVFGTPPLELLSCRVVSSTLQCIGRIIHLDLSLSVDPGCQSDPRGTVLWIAVDSDHLAVVTMQPRCTGPHHEVSSVFQHIDFG